jgi:MED6 mediator sub complex component
MLHILQTREAFEGRLQTMQGLEFMVAFEPSRSVGSQDGSENVWVIRKQTRRKRPGLEDEITVLGSYFVVNENIYMAPSVGLVIDSVMVRGNKKNLQAGVVMLIPRSPALYLNISDKVSLDGVFSSKFHPIIRVHIHSPSGKVPCTRQYSSFASQQGEYTYARCRPAECQDYGILQCIKTWKQL